MIKSFSRIQERDSEYNASEGYINKDLSEKKRKLSLESHQIDVAFENHPIITTSNEFRQRLLINENYSR